MTLTTVCAAVLLLAVTSPGQGSAVPDAPRPAMGVQADTAAGPVQVPPATPKAMAYYRGGIVLWVLGLAGELAVLALAFWSGFSARLQAFVDARVRRWYPRVVLYTVLFAAAFFVVSLPFAFYAGFVREHAYGLSNQTFGKWLRDTLIGAGLATGVAALILVPLLYLLLRRTRRWWLYLALLSVPFGLFTQIIAPIWIAPLFNRFEPMRDKALERRILSVASRAGIGGARIYQVDKSRDTPAVNAYVSGWLGTERIVLWDTALEKLDEPQLLFVLGHEMGHYVLHHVTAGLGLGFLVTLVGLFVVDRVGRRLIGRGVARHHVTRLEEVASLPLLLLVLTLVDLATSPVTNLYARHLEHEADRFGLELLHDNRAAAQMFVTLQGENLVNPRPGMLYELWLSDHPSLAERVEFANTYRPWAKGERGRYEGKFAGGK